jgi:hypothetical protein
MKNYNNIDFYHGSDEDILFFDIKKIGLNFDSSKAFYFTTNTFFETISSSSGLSYYEDMYSAGAYAKNTVSGNPVIYICNLEIKNPLTIKDLIYMYDLNKEAPFEGQHPQDFLDMNIGDILETMKNNNNDGVILDQSEYSEEKEITAMVLNPEQIKFKYKNKEIENYLSLKIENNKNNFESIVDMYNNNEIFKNDTGALKLENNEESIKDLFKKYACADFAYSCHLLTNWEMFQFDISNTGEEEYPPYHIAIKHPTKELFFDIDGFSTKKEIIKKYSGNLDYSDCYKISPNPMLIKEESDLKILCSFSKNLLEKEKIKIELKKKPAKRKIKHN